MRKNIGSFDGSTAQGRGNSSRKARPLNIFGGTAVSLVMLGCAFTVYSNVFGANIYPAVTTSGVEAELTPAQHESARGKSPASLLAAAYSPEVETSTFEDRFPVMSFSDRFPLAERSEQPEIADIQADLPKLPNNVRMPSPAMKQVASIPTPPRRPADQRTAQATQSTRMASAGELAQRAKATVAANTGSLKLNIFEKLFGKSQSDGPTMAYASADPGVQNDGRDSDAPAAPYDRSTAVYDISAHMVYMPDGTKLEAHSGLGSRLDDPRFVKEKMRGPTPPHVYDLALREALFHGVPALRLKPVGGDEAIYGRSGLLAHTYMLGPNGDSNGCVSFRNYDAFLQAYKNQHVKRLVVVAHISDRV
jgi:Protein of unknown function (DUF2778)